MPLLYIKEDFLKLLFLFTVVFGNTGILKQKRRMVMFPLSVIKTIISILFRVFCLNLVCLKRRIMTGKPLLSE
jgi:hypothetical protein